METSLWDALTRFVLPPLLGAAGGFTTIMATWGVEKRKLRLQQRKDHIALWRNELLPMMPPKTAWIDPLAAQIMATPVFASLAPHLSPDLLKKMSGDTVYIGGDFPRRELIEVIGKLEKRWGLV